MDAAIGDIAIGDIPSGVGVMQYVQGFADYVDTARVVSQVDTDVGTFSIDCDIQKLTADL